MKWKFHLLLLVIANASTVSAEIAVPKTLELRIPTSRQEQAGDGRPGTSTKAYKSVSLYEGDEFIVPASADETAGSEQIVADIKARLIRVGPSSITLKVIEEKIRGQWFPREYDNGEILLKDGGCIQGTPLMTDTNVDYCFQLDTRSEHPKLSYEIKTSSSMPLPHDTSR